MINSKDDDDDDDDDDAFDDESLMIMIIIIIMSTAASSISYCFLVVRNQCRAPGDDQHRPHWRQHSVSGASPPRLRRKGRDAASKFSQISEFRPVSERTLCFWFF